MSASPSGRLVTILCDWQDPARGRYVASLGRELQEHQQAAADMRKHGMDGYAVLQDQYTDGVRQELDSYLAQLGEANRLLEAHYPELLPLWGRRHADGCIFQDPEKLPRAVAQILAAVLARPAAGLKATSERLTGDALTQTVTELPPAPGSAPRVVLRGPDKAPLIDGREKPALSRAQYAAVNALVAAGQRGLGKSELDRKSGQGDARKLLKRLASTDPDWRNVIHFPGKKGCGGYRIQ